MADEFEPGDKVTWNYSGNEVEGTVKEKVTEETEIKGHKAKASPEDPEYLVESDKSGRQAIHRPESLDSA